jgi:hypothetical protein
MPSIKVARTMKLKLRKHTFKLLRVSTETLGEISEVARVATYRRRPYIL